MSVRVVVRHLAHGLGRVPARATDGAAGYDVAAAVPDGDPIVIAPWHRALVPTGLAIALPAGFEAQVRPRSGLAARHGVTVLNSPGTVDADYRGEVMVILVNLSDEAFAVTRGLRVAQLVFAPVLPADFSAAPSLEVTDRGERGFGSTGQT